MTYTNNVPQGNQTISSTQPLIQANFGFLENSIGQEHNFDDTDATKTYHLKASMPNQPDPGSLPTGTNGQYYVSGGKPKFYDGTNANFLAMGTGQFIPFNGSVSLNVGANTNLGPSGNVSGFVIVARSDGTFKGSAFFNFAAVGFQQKGFEFFDTDSGHINVGWSGSNLVLQNNGSQTYTFKYTGFYYPTV